eukprot:gnl/TRDRNA2_/TRDRNA2_161725_c2_seq1.p2 gnl/TRDRNA2_/TRDRNA2_161725_c2~~gnl/TRDRNA2_/TRDRNA2_161725_c2_seq1.p2  ORF type:complete len:101 (+),score=13.21 gnl/TRDRNA2_/TRDRNA2_161725_c2_seq1:69-371(+)
MLELLRPELAHPPLHYLRHGREQLLIPAVQHCRCPYYIGELLQVELRHLAHSGSRKDRDQLLVRAADTGTYPRHIGDLLRIELANSLPCHHGDSREEFLA